MIQILRQKFETKLGDMFACATNRGLCLLEFSNRKNLEKGFADIERRLGSQIVDGSNEHIETIKREIDEYFAGSLKQFTVSLDPQGTDFQKQIWDLLLKIPYGETASYMDQAKRLGNPNAVRAVANANGQNKLALVIPCHRIIGSDGSLTGYAAGVEKKKWLLELESQHS